MTRERFIDVWERPGPNTELRFINFDLKKGDPGTVIVYTQNLHSSLTSPEIIGRLDGHSTMIQGNMFDGQPFIATVRTTVNLSGGTIQLGGSTDGKPGHRYAVLGGTGEFEGARGTMLTMGSDGHLRFHLILDAEELQEDRGARLAPEGAAFARAAAAPQVGQSASASWILKSRLQEDIKFSMRDSAMKARTETIEQLYSAINESEAQAGRQLNEQQVRDVIEKLIRRRRESIGKHQADGHAERVAEGQEALAALEGYLPGTPAA